jgi:SAM-dependent methyltransferase
MGHETPAQRAKRERQRVLFDSVASLYHESRQGYPSQIVEWIAATAGLRDGSRVLETGCGTGQLTRQLVRFPIWLTAIDIAPAMVSRAQQELARSSVRFKICAFEDFVAKPHTFDLIVSGTAFHWIDPDIGWAKSVDLLTAGGWLALAVVAEEYEEPLRSSIHAIWIRHSDDGAAWAKSKQPSLAELIAATGLFEGIRETTHRDRVMMARSTVLGVERTRATFLSCDAATRESFTNELVDALDEQVEVEAIIETTVAMGQVPLRTAT